MGKSTSSVQIKPPKSSKRKLKSKDVYSQQNIPAESG
jgi:hypothetical protein